MTLQRHAAISTGGRKSAARAKAESVEFPVMLANHNPMIRVALSEMGAPEADIAAWQDNYREANGLTPPPPPVAPLKDDTWRCALGVRARESDARAFFVAEVERRGVDGAIRYYLPQFAPGMAASALHALMRLGYAVLADDAEEVGTALGYWVCTWLEVPRDVSATPKTSDPAEILAAIPGLPGVHDYATELDLLWHEIGAVSKLDGFDRAVGRLEVSGDTPRAMAATALALYAGTMDFAALHAVTGLHWLRLLRPHVEDPDALYPAFWAVIAALVPKLGFPDLPDGQTLDRMRAIPAPPWPEIFAAACASPDEHDISLVYSASEEEKVWDDRLYRVVAARRMGLIGPMA